MLAQFGVRQRWGWRGVAVVTLAGIAPDWDTAAKLAGDEHFCSLHHALGHNVFALILTAGLIAGVGSWLLQLRPLSYLFGWCLIASTVHALTDCLYWFAVKPLWPLQDYSIKWEILEYLDLIVLAIWLGGILCFLKFPQRATVVAATTLGLFTAYVAMRAMLPAPTGFWKFLTGGWMYEVPQGTPGFEWW